MITSSTFLKNQTSGLCINILDSKQSFHDDAIHVQSSICALQSWNNTALQHRSTATSQHCNIATPQHRNTAALQHRNTAALQHCSTAALQHCNITAQQYRNITGRLYSFKHIELRPLSDQSCSAQLFFFSSNITGGLYSFKRIELRTLSDQSCMSAQITVSILLVRMYITHL